MAKRKKIHAYNSILRRGPIPLEREVINDKLDAESKKQKRKQKRKQLLELLKRKINKKEMKEIREYTEKRVN